MEKTLVRLFAKTVCPTIRVKFTDEGCQWVNDTHLIMIDLDEDGEAFGEHLIMSHKFNGYFYNDNMWKVLHEIGHFFTMAECDEEQDEEDRLLLDKLFEKGLISENTLFKFYYDLETEYVATEWAINFINTHEKMCDMFNKLFERIGK